jgi:hypothetical protein
MNRWMKGIRLRLAKMLLRGHSDAVVFERQGNWAVYMLGASDSLKILPEGIVFLDNITFHRMISPSASKITMSGIMVEDKE